MSNWQLFLADSIAIDKTLQTSVDFGIRDQIPVQKDSSPSRLSFFVSLSNRGNQDPESTENTQEKKKKIEQNQNQNVSCNADILKFKSVILSVATVGLTLHPISTYYPEPQPTHTQTQTQTQTLTNTSSAIHRTTRPNTHTHSPHTSPQNLPAKSSSSSPLEVSARRKAISVLESMVQGSDLRKWFISPTSSSSSGASLRASGGGGSKVSSGE
jgi:hypothetical protein